MPVGIQRLNARHLQPSPNITFIKSLPGRDAAKAEEFLSRVAAITHPVLVKHHLSVMTLEEHEPNREFIGRNFNAGEIIQLVLKSKNGSWLPFRMVVMVMMHEIAHCKQMNHSRAFWKARNEFAGEMRELWSKGYTGEGMWGRGRELGSTESDWLNAVQQTDPGDIPDHLCGGAYRRRRRKRKGNGEAPASSLTYAERQQRRIAKKFGVNGNVLGENEMDRRALEKRWTTGKPRVAKSKRGRELRAAAALARFEQAKVKPEEATSDDTAANADDLSDTDDAEDDDLDGPSMEVVPDSSGTGLKDNNGRILDRVCGDEEPDDVHVKQEYDELWDLGQGFEHDNDFKGDQNPIQKATTEDIKPKAALDKSSSTKDQPVNPTKDPKNEAAPQPIKSERASDSPEASSPACQLCSTPYDITRGNRLCEVCSNVLHPKPGEGHWTCTSSTCEESKYINYKDHGVCQICGGSKSEFGKLL